ncbi:MAG: YdeI/OmpD-associated family protein [Chloroflexota bacterium]
MQQNHATHTQAWLVVIKNHAASPGVSYEEAVEQALCFGWIDGLMNSAAPEFYYLRFSPRKRRSIWSVSNQKRVERLIAQGEMTGAGMAAIREAKENGEWQAAILREDTSSLPEDLSQALDSNPPARVNFEKFPDSQKKQFLYWISSARTDKTRQKRIQDTVEMAANNKRLS